MITDLITSAQNIGIKIYLRDGQINIEMPWSVGFIPEPARAVLRELKIRKPELLAHFVLTSPGPDIRLYLEALRVYGVQLVTDLENGLRILVPETGCRQDDIIIKLLDKPLKDHWHIALEHLSAQNQHPPG
ncbi:MAG: hypothetical protein M0T74_07865 [Desulfitobacterium hafniense]|nr:hypothetical protein [Desulfitobacterium hafniense]